MDPSDPRPRARLLAVAGPLCGQAIEIDGELTIGRAGTNLLVIPDTTVSRHHCRIQATGDRIEIHDLQSRHGTFQNGKSIATAVLLDGDRIALGRSAFLVVSGSESSEGPVTIEVSDIRRQPPRPRARPR